MTERTLNSLIGKAVMAVEHEDDGTISAILFSDGSRLNLWGSPQIGCAEVFASVDNDYRVPRT